MVGHDRQQVVPGVDGVQSAPDDGEDDVDDDGADDVDDGDDDVDDDDDGDVDDGDYLLGPHHSLQRLYDGMPCSRPRWMFNDTRSIPNLAPGSWKGVWFESERLLVDC